VQVTYMSSILTVTIMKNTATNFKHKAHYVAHVPDCYGQSTTFNYDDLNAVQVLSYTGLT